MRTLKIDWHALVDFMRLDNGHIDWEDNPAARLKKEYEENPFSFTGFIIERMEKYRLDVEEEESKGEDDSLSDFIPIDNGTAYVRTLNIDGIGWEKQYEQDESLTWRLAVFFGMGGGVKYFYGDNAKSVMRTLGLPEEPPG